MAAQPPAADRPRWRERLLPRTVLGMSVLILVFALGAAFSGTILYAYYEYRLDATERRVATFIRGFDSRFRTATKTIEAEREAAKQQIRDELEPLQRVAAVGETLKKLLDDAGPSVWFVRTLDESGAPSVGSAFVVASDAEQSLLLASFSTVKAATRSPGPSVTVRNGDQEVRATVYTWQEERDLALLVIPRGNTPRLKWVEDTPATKVGERVFAVSGVGGAGGSITQGFVADLSAAGVQHDAPIGPAFQGGPLLTSKGEVVGVASRSYAPLGYASDGVYFGVPINAACERVLRCPSGSVSGAGNRR